MPPRKLELTNRNGALGSKLISACQRHCKELEDMCEKTDQTLRDLDVELVNELK